MQYAVMTLKDREFLIDIHEHIALDRHRDAILDLAEDEDAMPFKVVYGAYKPQPGISAEEAAENIKRSVGYALGHVKDSTCRAMELCDIMLFDAARRGHALDIPFAALIRTHVDIPSGTTQAVTAFLRYAAQMTPATNILNRPGLFAIKAQESRIRVPVTRENWRGFVDAARAGRAARKAV